jgi:hypothetical protein
MVGASKRFTNPAIYAFSNAIYATFDGGESWIEAPPLILLPGWAGTSDPAVAWDDMGNAYLVALPFGAGTPTDFTGLVLGVAVYKSSDGGRTWGPPILIHAGSSDDKQWATGDGSPASPHFGNVYTAWDKGSQLAFARTTDHGTTWRGIGTQPAGTSIPGVFDSFAPELSVADDGTVYIVWLNTQAGSQIKFVKSTDGGDTFSTPMVAASGVTSLRGALPEISGWPVFPGATFRVLTLPTGCTGSGNVVIFAWADMRGSFSRIYYRRSSTGGNTWEGPDSGQPLLTGEVASEPGYQDFHPQIINTPSGEIGCAFYTFGRSGEFDPNLIDVILAVSTDNGITFPHRVKVTEQPWDPTLDAPFVHGNPEVTFIGEYFGLDASRLGFFPLWTDTRTSVQEIFSARIAVNPADVYIRDSSSDTGDVPDPGFHWEAPDLIVRRQPDGETNFTNEDLLRDGITDHYVYGRVTNRGPNVARNVRLAVTIGNYPSLQALPGSEFRYPQDWYPGDWNTVALQNNHLFLGESSPVDLADTETRILGPVLWPASQIPPPASWHPCVLGEARADNNDSAGGSFGCAIDADPDPCVFGSYFWGNNNVCQRNLSYTSIPSLTAAYIELPFLVGSVWSSARFIEVIVDKGRDLAFTPMILRMEKICPPDEPPCRPGEIVLVEECRVVVRVDNCDVGEIIATPGTVWRPTCQPPKTKTEQETCFGAEKVGQQWTLTQPKSAVGFPVADCAVRRMTLSFTTPTTLQPGTRTLLRIFQRNDRRVITGSVVLELQVYEAPETLKKDDQVETDLIGKGAARRKKQKNTGKGAARRKKQKNA